MSRHEPCEVPGCVRYAGKIRGFCNRCWTLATDDERAAIYFSRHAPFFPRYMRHDPEEPVPEGFELKWGELRQGDRSFTDIMRAWEAEAVQCAVARAIGDRRRYRYAPQAQGAPA